MKTHTCSVLSSLFFIMFLAFGCENTSVVQLNLDSEDHDHAHMGDSEDGGEDAILDESITQERSMEIALKYGVNPSDIIYHDMLPYMQPGANSAEMTWGFIERPEDGDFFVTYLDQFTGDLIAFRDLAPENILNFLSETGLDQDVSWGATPGTYNSFPWDWRLPVERGTLTLTRGYGVATHSGALDYYATDWAGNSGHLLESPASCWVTYSGYNGAYGYELIAECGSAGNGQRYGYRVSHMTGMPLEPASTWIGKGRNIGYMGMSGNATGPHTHFVVFRGSINGRSISGNSLPINNWPANGDGICNGAFSGYNFAGEPWRVFTLATTGCP